MIRSATHTIAIVDDDSGIRRAMLRLLHAEGYRAKAYGSAEAFIADSAQHRFDCLLLDVQLGGMSGLGLQRHLNASAAAPPIVFISAHAEPEYRDQAERAGCSAFLRKTDPGSAVIAAIRRATESPGATGPNT